MAASRTAGERRGFIALLVLLALVLLALVLTMGAGRGAEPVYVAPEGAPSMQPDTSVSISKSRRRPHATAKEGKGRRGASESKPRKAAPPAPRQPLDDINN